MFERAGLLFMYTLTPLHPGSGASLAGVDLPIQRERHSGFPMIQASGVKGALRDLASCLGSAGKLDGGWAATVKCVFGPDASGAAEHGGAIAFTDARLCLFPVRSARGVFAWTTCPAVVARLARDLQVVEMLGKGGVASSEVSDLAESLRLGVGEQKRGAGVPAGTSLTLDGTIVLEELAFAVSQNLAKNTGELAKWFNDNAIPGGPTLKFWRDKLMKDLVVVGDDDFRYLVETCTELITRVKLGERGTVDAGPWDEEHIPAESLFYTVVLATRPRAPDGGEIKAAADVLEFLGKVVERAPVLQLGGDGTLGRGLVEMRLVHGVGSSGV